MRSSLPLLVATVLLGLVTADFVRRAVAMQPTSPWTVRLTASQRNALGAMSKREVGLESYDGTISTLKMVVRPESPARIAEVTLREVSLDGKLPDEPPPWRFAADTSGAVTLRLHFRGVAWTVREPGDPKAEFESCFAERMSVLYAGCDPVDAKTGSESFPLRVSTGPGHADLVRLRGGR